MYDFASNFRCYLGCVFVVLFMCFYLSIFSVYHVLFSVQFE